MRLCVGPLVPDRKVPLDQQLRHAFDRSRDTVISLVAREVGPSGRTVTAAPGTESRPDRHRSPDATN